MKCTLGRSTRVKKDKINKPLTLHNIRSTRRVGKGQGVAHLASLMEIRYFVRVLDASSARILPIAIDEPTNATRR